MSLYYAASRYPHQQEELLEPDRMNLRESPQGGHPRQEVLLQPITQASLC
jgi:hypothetical protein